MTEIAAARLEALLRGEAGRDVSERRVAAIVAELRGAPARAPERLRERVLAQVPPAPRVTLPRVPLRRTLLVLAPAAAAAILVGAVISGVVGSSGGRRAVEPTVAGTTVPQPAHVMRGTEQGSKKSTFDSAQPLQSRAAGQTVVPPTGGRLTDVQASLRLRVKNLDALGDATAQAQRIVRGLGGYVQSIDYTAPRGRPGNSYVELRVPVRRVQDALLRLSGLGTVVEQQVSTRDLEAIVQQQNARIAALRQQIRRIEETLRTSLPPEERLRLEFQLDDAKRALASRTRARKGTIREGSIAKISLQLTTEKAASPVTPVERGRFDRAVRGSLGFLAGAAAVALAVLIALSPLVLLAAMWFAASRMRRRRDERRLLHATQ